MTFIPTTAHTHTHTHKKTAWTKYVYP